jgi:hypothetical protein
MRGFYWLKRKKMIAAANPEISYSPANSSIWTCFFSPAFFRTAFSALQKLSSSCKFALFLSQIALFNSQLTVCLSALLRSALIIS